MARGRCLNGESSYEVLAARVAPGQNVLDIGCGDGVGVEALCARGARVTAVDASLPELIAARARMGAKPVRWVQADAAALPFAAASFDVVVCHMAFMLFVPLAPAIAEVARVLRPKGACYAILGGAPPVNAAVPEAMSVFVELLAHVPPGERHRIAVDPAVRRPAAWHALWAQHAMQAHDFERIELCLDGSCEQVWDSVAESYELAQASPATIARLRAAFGEGVQPLANPLSGIIPMRWVLWLAKVDKAT